MKEKFLKEEERYENRGTWGLQSKAFFLKVDGGHYWYCYSLFPKHIL